MPTNLTVIFGAGASFDVVNPKSIDLLRDRHKLRFRPPVTANIFNTHEEWAEEYKKFPAVASLVQEIRQSLPEKHTSVNVEDFLKTLKDSPRVHRNNQFRQIPLYLQHYFYRVSTNYCKWPANYVTLINKIFDLDLGKVTFVTTNYDLLFDQALELSPATNFTLASTAPSKYINSSEWAYIKIHGSVDWGRSINEDMVKNRGNTLSALCDNIDQLGPKLEEALVEEINIDKSFMDENDRKLIYPAISVPVGESKLNCWPDHIQILKDHLNRCQNYLIIGFSGYDKDILEMLDQKEGGFNKVMFVSGSGDSANEARMNFMQYGSLGQKLQTHADTFSGNGFDEFVKSTVGLSAYLQRLS